MLDFKNNSLDSQHNDNNNIQKSWIQQFKDKRLKFEDKTKKFMVTFLIT